MRQLLYDPAKTFDQNFDDGPVLSANMTPASKVTSSFASELAAAVTANNSLLCVGLDPDLEKLPVGVNQFEFCKAIIGATADLVCAFKPQSAFFEAAGAEGIAHLKQTCDYLREQHPEIPIILDAKRGDIGSTNQAYAKFCFEYLRVNAVTLQPYLGSEALEPFLNYEEKGLIILIRTSNPGAGELQDLLVGEQPFYQIVAQRAIQNWNARNNIGLVVGATYPDELAAVREIAGPDIPILVPGVGAQSGQLKATLQAGLNDRGDGLIINASRSVIFAGSGPDFAQAARAEAIKLQDEINLYRPTAAPIDLDLKTEIALELHRIGALKFGEFTFKSGVKSPMYLDMRLFVSHPDVLEKVAKVFAKMLEPLKFDRLAGIPYAAMPIAGAVSLEMRKPWIFKRKESKGYGLGKDIEGEYQSGETVAIIDYLVTKGDSKLETIDPFEAAGLRVKDVVVLIDYQKGGSALLRSKGYRLHAAITMREVVDILRDHGKIEDQIHAEVFRFLSK